MPTKTFNMLCKPTNLQYVPWTTNKALRTSIRPFDHQHRHSIKQHAYDRERCHSYLQLSIGPTTPPLRHTVRSWDYQH